MPTPPPDLELRHYVAIRDELPAAQAARALRSRGLVVEGHHSGDSWQLIARPTVDRFDLVAAEVLVDHLASEFDGTYQGSRIVHRGSPV